jgi:hypothetical protein
MPQTEERRVYKRASDNEYAFLSFHRAAKDHECNACGLTIPRGAVYCAFTLKLRCNWPKSGRYCDARCFELDLLWHCALLLQDKRLHHRERRFIRESLKGPILGPRHRSQLTNEARDLLILGGLGIPLLFP